MKETLKLALEALEKSTKYFNIVRLGESRLKDSEIRGASHAAITAIKEALAQPTSADYAMGYAEGFNDACKKPEQEPVAFISPGGHIHYDPYLDSVPLYTTPPKRPWVGLTDEERNYCVETPFVSQQWANIEAKLKELNT